MAPISPPTWLQAGSYSARADRLLLAALLGYPGFTADEATPLRIRQGVKPSYQNYQLKVRAAGTPNMTVIVSPGFVWVDNHDLAGYGAYACVNDADYTITVPAAGGSGQFRKDCIVASVYDAETAGSANEFRIELIQGPYAASAGATARGTLPPNAQILADIAVGASVTSISNANISDIRQFAVGAGGVVPLTSAADMNHPAPGQLRYITDLGIFRYGKLDGTSGDFTPDQTIAWTTATLGTGYTQGDGTTNGNLNGPIRYRKVIRDGIPWMEWAGGANRANGAQTTNILSAALAAAFRPVYQASLVIARNATSITSVANTASVVHSVKIDFKQDGTVGLVGATAGDTETNWLSLQGVAYPLA
ncbi:hypothetical protein [Streptomyces sp. MI02-7b]|uniref:hypothetical protein n=1 Tax=Streptomyces sp. MI02-7b TaxID=462941 RepID=UPI0029AB96D4|nr:hypothetical protein [Streptomyces sp. MI02-7b]MDX3074627.1 hypothetical protein [Streptomyces sp. MI02-7b]